MKLRGQLWNFEDNLSAKGILYGTDKPAGQERVSQFHNPPIYFHTTHFCRAKEKKARVRSAPRVLALFFAGVLLSRKRLYYSLASAKRFSDSSTKN